MLPHGIMFHHFHNKKHFPAQGSITSKEFADMILYLIKRGSLLSAEDWYQKAISNKLEPKDICLTFDDNLRCQFDIAFPVLKDFNIKAFWFIYTSPLERKVEKLELYRYYRTTQFNHINEFYDAFSDAIRNSKYQKEIDLALKGFVPDDYLKDCPFYSKEDRTFRYVRDIVLGKKKYDELMDSMIANSNLDLNEIHKLLWMDKTCLQELRKHGNIIGLHSHTHPTDLMHLTRDEQEWEYKKNYLKLKEVLGEDIVSISHPSNSYSDTTLEILKEMKILLGFRANMSQIQYSQLEHPRLDCALLRGGKK